MHSRDCILSLQNKVHDNNSNNNKDKTMTFSLKQQVHLLSVVARYEIATEILFFKSWFSYMFMIVKIKMKSKQTTSRKPVFNSKYWMKFLSIITTNNILFFKMLVQDIGDKI